MHLNADLLNCTCRAQKPKDKLKGWLHTPAEGKYPKDTPKRCSHIPAEGKSPRFGPLHSQGYLIMLLGALKHMFGALRA